MPESYISARVQGIPQGPHKTEIKSDGVLEDSSHVYARYLPVSDGTMVNRHRYSLSNNKTTIGYSAQGLPFLLLATGDSAQDAQELAAFIDNEVQPLIEELSTQLAAISTVNTDKIEPLIRKLIDDIFVLRKKDEKNFNFMLSLAVTFTNRYKKYCLGIGLGDNGIVLFDGEKPHQLVSRTKIEDTLSAFCDEVENIKPRLLQGMSINLFEVKSGLTLTAYTPSANIEEELIDEEAQVTRYNLKPGITSREILIQESERKSDVQESERKSEAPKHVDCMIASVKIPEAHVQHRIQAHLFNESNNLLQRKLENLSVDDPRKEKGEKIQHKISNLILQNNAPTDLYIRAMSRAHAVLDNNSPQRIQRCKDFANHLKGKPSLALKVLGGLLMVFGVAAIGIGLAVTPTFAGVPLVTGGASMFTLGVAFFQMGTRTGLSKNVYQFGNTAQEERKEEENQRLVRVT